MAFLVLETFAVVSSPLTYLDISKGIRKVGDELVLRVYDYQDAVFGRIYRGLHTTHLAQGLSHGRRWWMVSQKR